jgi:hypothetical protein
LGQSSDADEIAVIVIGAGCGGPREFDVGAGVPRRQCRWPESMRTGMAAQAMAMASRGIRMNQLMGLRRWWSGCACLHQRR